MSAKASASYDNYDVAQFQELIRSNQAILCSRIDPRHGLLVTLSDKGVLTDRQLHSCKAEKTDEDCVEYLLDILKKLDDYLAMCKFYDALTETGQGHLLKYVKPDTSNLQLYQSRRQQWQTMRNIEREREQRQWMQQLHDKPKQEEKQKKLELKHRKQVYGIAMADYKSKMARAVLTGELPKSTLMDTLKQHEFEELLRKKPCN